MVSCPRNRQENDNVRRVRMVRKLNREEKTVETRFVVDGEAVW
jgi:hypothetical protein